MALESNIFNTALVFEGGSMRAAYTCAVVVKLLEEELYFNDVYGVSAGSSNTVNYLSRDAQRAHNSFTTFLANPKVGDWKTMLMHKGMFNAHYIYQEACYEEGLRVDFDTIQENPANVTIVSMDRDTGEDLYFTREGIHTLDDLMVRVRASSTIPVFMPPPRVGKHVCYDGGFARGGGLPLEKVLEDGFEKIVVIRTRPREYTRKPGSPSLEKFLWRRPAMRQAAATRQTKYNEMLKLLAQLEEDGRAWVFYPEELTLSGTERDVELLEQNYQAGYAQITRQLPSLKQFLGI